MTDNEIIKALRCCAQPIPICKECPCYDSNVPYPCADQLKWAALNLIDSQKAEIEKLTINMNAFGLGMKQEKENIDIAKAEAVKEFAEKVKEKLQWDVKYDNKLVFENDIDEIVKEMAGDAE